MGELVVFGYVAIVVALFVAVWAGWHIFREFKEEWMYEYRRDQAFTAWRNKRNGIGGTE